MANTSAGTAVQVRQTSVMWSHGRIVLYITRFKVLRNHANGLQFQTVKERGLLNLTSLSDVNNGVHLCGLCHDNFDDINNVGFVFTPEDLPFFIRYEQNDAERRRQLRALGHPTTRMSPTYEIYREGQINTGRIPESFRGGIYERYTLRDYFPSKLRTIGEGPRTGALVDTAPWHGDPMAALKRTLAVLGNIDVRGIPSSKRTELNELNELYRQNDEDEENLVLERKEKNWRDPNNPGAAEDDPPDDSPAQIRPLGISRKGQDQDLGGVAGVGEVNEQSNAHDSASVSMYNMKMSPLQDSSTTPALATPPASLKSSLPQYAHAHTNTATPAIHLPTTPTRWSPRDHGFSMQSTTPATFYRPGSANRKSPSQMAFPDTQTSKLQATSLESNTPSLRRILFQSETLSAGATLLDMQTPLPAAILLDILATPLQATLVDTNSLPSQATLLEGPAFVSAGGTQTKNIHTIDNRHKSLRARTFLEGDGLGKHHRHDIETRDEEMDGSNFDAMDSSHTNNGHDIHNRHREREDTKRRASRKPCSREWASTLTDESSNQSARSPPAKRRMTKKFTVDQQEHLADMERREEERRRNRDLPKSPRWKWGPWATTQDKLDFHEKIRASNKHARERARSPKDG